MKLSSQVKAVKEEKSYGHLTLNSADHPEVLDCKIGETKELTITVKVKGLRQPDRWEISEKQMKPKDVVANVIITDIKHKSSEKKTN